MSTEQTSGERSAVRGHGARASILALALLVPVPTAAVWAGMIAFPDRPLGVALFALGKVWMLAFPLWWQWRVDREPMRPRPSWRGVGVGLASGLAIAAGIVAAAALGADRLIDVGVMRDRLGRVGLLEPGRYLVGAAYWTVVNSLLEEFVWRWFVARHAARLMPAGLAVLFSAAAFTLHHLVAMAVYWPPATVALAGLGVAFGGAVWSVLLARYGTVWPAYVSHALVDAAVFGLGYRLLFSA